MLKKKNKKNYDMPFNGTSEISDVAKTMLL
jgi:hypothetical protein